MDPFKTTNNLRNRRNESAMCTKMVQTDTSVARIQEQITAIKLEREEERWRQLHQQNATLQIGSITGTMTTKAHLAPRLYLQGQRERWQGDGFHQQMSIEDGINEARSIPNADSSSAARVASRAPAFCLRQFTEQTGRKARSSLEANRNFARVMSRAPAYRLRQPSTEQTGKKARSSLEMHQSSMGSSYSSISTMSTEETPAFPRGEDETQEHSRTKLSKQSPYPPQYLRRSSMASTVSSSSNQTCATVDTGVWSNFLSSMQSEMSDNEEATSSCCWSDNNEDAAVLCQNHTSTDMTTTFSVREVNSVHRDDVVVARDVPFWAIVQQPAPPEEGEDGVTTVPSQSGISSSTMKQHRCDDRRTEVDYEQHNTAYLTSLQKQHDVPTFEDTETEEEVDVGRDLNDHELRLLQSVSINLTLTHRHRRRRVKDQKSNEQEQRATINLLSSVSRSMLRSLRKSEKKQKGLNKNNGRCD